MNNWPAHADERRYLERLAPDVRALIAIGKPINVAADSRNNDADGNCSTTAMRVMQPPFRKLNGNSPSMNSLFNEVC